MTKIDRLHDSLDVFAFKAYAAGDLPFRCVFTGRNGGVSSGSCSSLNLSFVPWDNPVNVRENRTRLCNVIDCDPHQLFFQEQIHGPDIGVVEQPWTNGASAREKGSFIPRTDALITLRRGLVLAARAADCQLIGIGDSRTGAVASIHAGWRSTVQGIAALTLRKLIDLTGSGPESMYVFFGPAAGPCCYEVGPEFRDVVRSSRWVTEEHLVEKSERSADQRFSDSQRLHFDLWKANTDQLLAEGIDPQRLVNPEICTICNHDHFFSYRVLGQHVGGHSLLMWGV